MATFLCSPLDVAKASLVRDYVHNPEVFVCHVTTCAALERLVCIQERSHCSALRGISVTISVFCIVYSCNVARFSPCEQRPVFLLASDSDGQTDMSGFSAELIDYLEGRITFEEFDKRRDERKTKVKWQN